MFFSFEKVFVGLRTLETFSCFLAFISAFFALAITLSTHSDLALASASFFILFISKYSSSLISVLIILLSFSSLSVSIISLSVLIPSPRPYVRLTSSASSSWGG